MPLVVALISLALVCYQHAPAAPWVALMGFSFAAAEALHYYAFFAVVPFAVAEIALGLKEGKLRIPVWLAFAVAFVPPRNLFPAAVAPKVVLRRAFLGPAYLV